VSDATARVILRGPKDLDVQPADALDRRRPSNDGSGRVLSAAGPLRSTAQRRDASLSFGYAQDKSRVLKYTAESVSRLKIDWDRRLVRVSDATAHVILREPKDLDVQPVDALSRRQPSNDGSVRVLSAAGALHPTAHRRDASLCSA
jgi:hypothetical protein